MILDVIRFLLRLVLAAIVFPVVLLLHPLFEFVSGASIKAAYLDALDIIRYMWREIGG